MELLNLGRASLKHIRIIEIFEAFAQCIAQKGIQATSMEDVSNQANMKRNIIRHYIGNRDELIDSFGQYFFQLCQDEFDRILESINDEKLNSEILKLFFPLKPSQGVDNVFIIENLIAYSSKSPSLLKASNQYIEYITKKLQTYLFNHYPKANQKESWNVAYGLICLWFNQESLITLQQAPAYHQAAKSCAKSLLLSLDKN